MKDNFHDAQSFSIVLDSSYSIYGEKRYVIMDKEKKTILDDALGSGYTSYKKAYRCATFKLKNKMSFVSCYTNENK